MTTKRILRYEVPVDDHVHEISLAGDPLSVECRDPYRLEFWAQWTDEVPETPRRFVAVGTGHRLPDKTICHWGTAITGGGLLVWHLIEVQS